MIESHVNRIAEAIAEVSGVPAALHEPSFRGKEQEYVADCLATGWVSTVGGYVDQIEQRLSQYCGSAATIATCNGTAALHAALVLAGVERDDEVIVPSLSFVATANAVSYIGAIPHFTDVDETTLGLSPAKLEQHLQATLETADNGYRNKLTGRRVSAIVPMHTFGHACEIDRLCEVAAKYELPIIEDAAESLGSFYNEQHTGTFGRLGIISFNGNKIATAGGGGAILTQDTELGKNAKHLTTTAKSPHRWEYEHDLVGFNYRMPNLNAALACAQMELLDEFLADKRALFGMYADAFSDLRDVQLIAEPKSSRSNHWLIAIRVANREVRDQLLEATNEMKLMTRPCWRPLNRLAMYETCPKSDLSCTDALYETTVCIPSSAKLGRCAA